MAKGKRRQQDAPPLLEAPRLYVGDEDSEQDYFSLNPGLAAVATVADAEKARLYRELCEVTGMNYTKARKRLERSRNNPGEWVELLRWIKSGLRGLK